MTSMLSDGPDQEGRYVCVVPSFTHRGRVHLMEASATPFDPYLIALAIYLLHTEASARRCALDPTLGFLKRACSIKPCVTKCYPGDVPAGANKRCRPIPCAIRRPVSTTTYSTRSNCRACAAQACLIFIPASVSSAYWRARPVSTSYSAFTPALRRGHSRSSRTGPRRAPRGARSKTHSSEAI